VFPRASTTSELGQLDRLCATNRSALPDRRSIRPVAALRLEEARDQQDRQGEEGIEPNIAAAEDRQSGVVPEHGNKGCRR
jgi:hypothetical protein